MMISVERNGEAEAEALLGTDDDERNPVLHPNGFWMAYQSEETGEREVYVRPFPNVDGTQIAISNATGLDPAFSRDGSELFYLEIAEGGMRMMSVAIEEASEDAFEFSVPTPLFDFPYLSGFGQRHYDVAPDASRFLVIGQPSIGGDQRFIIVQNWFEELNELVPTD